uniref:NADH dehydrogenase subunit 1 n=1 Tax=Aclerda takahashii TaxID=2936620 RepID=UPI002029322D|nr:NADH dehydrogenase subunit 1 [Aclerda takahashii]UPO69105.1 NADH dehydrogenase subunit 1 [Aclerda takahashii]
MMFFFMMLNYFIGVGFFMFIERKILGLAQIREGPSKILFKGNVQFLMDLIKLVLKFWNELIFMGNLFLYLIMPFILFMNMIIMWFFFPFIYVFFNNMFSIIYLIVLLTLKMMYFMFMVYLLYSIYSVISVIRMVVQIISYDIVLILILIYYFLMHLSFKFSLILLLNEKFNLSLFFSLMMFVFWLISIMVELIRLPFDFYEGESELISGFNIEFSSLLFMVLVLVEYMEMIYFMMMTLFLFIYSITMSFIFYLMFFLMVFFLIWIRVFFVRYRLDKMMVLLWKFMFPLCIMIIMFFYYYNFF